MNHNFRIVAAVAVLAALVLWLPVQAQTPEQIDEDFFRIIWCAPG